VADLTRIAEQLIAAYDGATLLPPITAAAPDFSVADGYAVLHEIETRRRAQGWRPVGRKIGFTNRTIWPQYGVYAPIWGYVFDRSMQDLAVADTLSLGKFSEPRIEPEIIFGLASAPSIEMDETSLASCIAWVALGFEIVQSIFPDWKFAAADTIAANGVHGALLVGPRHPYAPRTAEWQRDLSTFEIDLICGGRLIDHGHAGNVLNGPLSALRHLVELLSRDPVNPPLAAGEVVSTGTLTKAMPVRPGEVWTAKCTGISLDAVSLRFT